MAFFLVDNVRYILATWASLVRSVGQSSLCVSNIPRTLMFNVVLHLQPYSVTGDHGEKGDRKRKKEKGDWKRIDWKILEGPDA